MTTIDPARQAIDALLGGDLERWLAEDIGDGDRTAAAIVPADARVAAVVIAKADGVVAGLPLAEPLFRLLGGVEVAYDAQDGDDVQPGQPVMRLRGDARAILTGERTLLNLVGRLSGTATLARAFRRAIGDAPAQLVDTRKTTPGLRHLQKYAVTCGGGVNHRTGLFDGILVKENHLFAAGAKGDPARFAEAVRAAVRAGADEGIPVQVEVEDLDELRWALDAGAPSVLLDNMAPATLREAVAINGGRAVLEASGGVDLTTIGAIAATGVDRISVGALTHSAPALDLSLRVVESL